VIAHSNVRQESVVKHFLERFANGLRTERIPLEGTITAASHGARGDNYGPLLSGSS
jgi:hypothetical protein